METKPYNNKNNGLFTYMMLHFWGKGAVYTGMKELVFNMEVFFRDEETRVFQKFRKIV